MATLTSGQTEFARQLARQTGLNSRVISSWLLAEESGGAAQQREKQGNNNWLNIGYFDSGAGGLTKDKVWSDPTSAAAATADFLKGSKYGASKGIRQILDTAGSDQAAQIKAIAGSGWASSGYNGGDTLRRLLQEAPAPGAAGSPVTGGSGSSTSSAAPEAAQAQPWDTASGGTGLADLLGQMQAAGKPAAPQSMGVAAPAFSAAPALPQGYQAPQPGGGGAAGSQGSDLTSLLQGVSGMQPAQMAPASAPTAATGETAAQASPSASAAAAKGKVIVGSGANRAGVNLSPGILKLAEQVAAQAGETLTIGTGTNHDEMTTSGNVSDHWSGNGVDIPKSGVELTRLGASALQALGGYSQAEALKLAKKGGIFNLPYGKHRRIQVIVNTNEGGNHFNHLHIGVTANAG